MMIGKHKKMLISLGIIAIIVLSIYLCFRFDNLLKGTYKIEEYNKLSEILLNKIDFKLPATAVIHKFDCDNKEESFQAIIQINKEDITSVRNQLDDAFKGHSKSELSKVLAYNRHWHLNEENIDSYYQAMTGRDGFHGNSWSTVIVWVIITKEKAGIHYLYISF